MPWWTVIGFLILLVLGTLLTLYYLKPNTPEGFQSASGGQQLYLISNSNGSNMSYDDAVRASILFGGRLALATEVYNAAVAGTGWSTPGWIAGDKIYGYVPVPAGSSNSDVSGPCIARVGAEWQVDCNSNYTPILYQGIPDNALLSIADAIGLGGAFPHNAPSINMSAICYGILPASITGYTIYPTGGSYSISIMDFSNWVSSPTTTPSLFDTATTYTLIDLDAINIQKDAITIDMEIINKQIYDIEKTSITGVTQNNSLAISDRLQTGYLLASKHLDVLKALSEYYESSPLTINPFNPIVQAFSMAAQNNNIIPFNNYLIMLLNNINMYFSDIIRKVTEHPLGFITSGTLNAPMYINAAGLIPLVAGDWEYKLTGGEIHKQRPPPYPGCGTYNYGMVPQNNLWKGRNANTVTMHCPSGVWWRDKRSPSVNGTSGETVTTIGAVLGGVFGVGLGAAVGAGAAAGVIAGAGTCPDGWTKPAWDMTYCYKEWPVLNNKITLRDVKLIQISSITTMITTPYPQTFLAAADGWTPVANTDDSRAVISQFLASKAAIANTYHVTPANSYRWKPISFVGTISAINRAEAKQSAILAALFNFSSDTGIEQQIRVASTPPFKLSYSKQLNARPEFVQIQTEATHGSSSQAELLTALTVIGVVTSVVSGVIGARAGYRAATATGSAATSAARIASRANIAGLAGAAVSIGGAAGMLATQRQGTGASLKMAASNADYNASVCTEFTEQLFNVLPYQTREFVSIWAMLRKGRMVDWYITNVMSSSAGNNPPGGPYQGAPAAAAIAASNVNSPTAFSTIVNGVTYYDASANIFGTGSSYVLSDCYTINSIPTAETRNTIYDSIAQTYYTLSAGVAHITKILDVFQVGTTLFDVRFTESRRSGSNTFVNKISTINGQYAEYRSMQLSQNQLDTLETNYNQMLKPLYEGEAKDLIDSATDCGIKARYVKVTRTGDKQFNLRQLIVINNYGQNVAYYIIPKVSSTELAQYEDACGQTFYDSNYSAYSVNVCRKLASDKNAAVIYNKIALITDGTYLQKYDGSYKSLSTESNSSILLDLGKPFDLTSVSLIHSTAMAAGTFQLDLMLTSATATPIKTQSFTCTSTGFTTVSLLRPNRNPDLPTCPTGVTDIYSQYKVARFFATLAPRDVPARTAGTTVSKLIPTFTGYAEGLDAATTFNPLYNAGFTTDITDRTGNVSYVPKTVFNIVPQTTLDHSSNSNRMANVFKDYLFYENESLFRNIPSVKTLLTPYSDKYIYRPASVLKVASATADNYNCAYVWKENVYDSDDGSIMASGATLEDGKSTQLDSQSQITRYGILRYEYDTSNWVSRGVVFNLSSTVLFNTEAQLQSTIGTIPLSTLTPPAQLYVPYFDSMSLDTLGGQCPQTDCSDPAVIADIISKYNNHTTITNDNKIVRVTKALTTSPSRCDYEFLKKGSVTPDRLSFVVQRTIDPKTGICSYAPYNNIVGGQLYASTTASVYLSDSTPLLARAFNYASDSVATYVNRISQLYTEMYTNYLAIQTDPGGNGILGDLIRYRNTTQTAAGQLRNVSMIDQPILNEVGSTCSTMCNSPEILQSFFAYYNTHGSDKVTQIQNAGMDVSGNCDFTYTAAAVVMEGGVGVLNTAGAQTRAAKFQINRYPNSCAYSVTGTPAAIMPTPSILDLMNFSTITLFGNTNNNPVGPSTINSAETGITGSAGAPIQAPGNPFLQPTIASQALTESVDYINCLSKYAMNSISSIGITGLITGAVNVNSRTCAVNIGGTQRQYAFIPQASVVGIAPQLVATQTTGPSVTLSSVTSVNIATFNTITPASAVVCSAPATKALTGFSGSIVGVKTVSADTCEYKITPTPTLPFANSFQRVSFYTGNLTNPTGTDLHVRSIANSNPASSPFAYFQNANLRSSFINDYMALFQLFRYNWNSQFYVKSPKNTSYWKIGKISAIGLLANEDAVVFEAESSLYGMYGSYDVRDYASTRYFKFTPRINTPDGVDTNNYSNSPYTINNIILYRSVDSATSFGSYRLGPLSVSTDQYDSICTYNNINYNTKWYDLSGGTGTAPTTAPPATYTVQSVETSLTYGVYNRLRFTVTKSQMPTTGPSGSNRAEIARLMFYDISGYDAASQPIYNYIPIPNGTIEIQDISSTYLLVQSGKRSCDVGFREIINPNLNLAECIYTQNTGSEYTTTNPQCNAGDSLVSNTNGTLRCLTVTMPTYNKPAGVACGIGYFGNTTGTQCTLVGNFQGAIQDPSYLFNLNQAQPRLRLEVGKYMLIYLNQTVHIAGFSFITGSSGTLPLRWTLEGSMNGINWATIHCQGVDYNYANAHARTSLGATITSFFTPGIFLINRPGSSGTNCTMTGTTTGTMTSAGYSNYNLPAYATIVSNINEGFQNSRRVASKPTAKQFQVLKFQIGETYDPNSKFVHMSNLEILTHSGKIPRGSLKLSNLQGSRNSPREGPAALLEGPGRRWVDYNKSDLLIQILETSEPITGFRFSVPQGVQNSMNAMPIEWTMYGSYDNKNWIVLHEFSGTTLPMINSSVTIMFKFNTA